MLQLHFVMAIPAPYLDALVHPIKVFSAHSCSQYPLLLTLLCLALRPSNSDPVGNVVSCAVTPQWHWRSNVVQ